MKISSMFIFPPHFFLRKWCMQMAITPEKKKRKSTTGCEIEDLEMNSDEEEEELEMQRKKLKLKKSATTISSEKTNTETGENMETNSNLVSSKSKHKLLTTFSIKKEKKPWFKNMAPHKVFENTILILIISSSLMLSIDNPLNDPASNLSKVLFYIDAIFTFVFLIEAMIKVRIFF
jgi:hypothetical protein